MLTRKTEGRHPELAQIDQDVRGDADREFIAAQQDKAIQAIVATYQVRRNLERPPAGHAEKE